MIRMLPVNSSTRESEQWYPPERALRDGGADVNMVGRSEARRAGLKWRTSAARISLSTGSVGGVLGEVIDAHRVEYVLGLGTPQEARYTLSPTHKLFVVDDTHLYGWLLGSPHDRAVGGYVDHVGDGDDASQGAYRYRSRFQHSGDKTVDGSVPLLTSQLPGASTPRGMLAYTMSALRGMFSSNTTPAQSQFTVCAGTVEPQARRTDGGGMIN